MGLLGRLPCRKYTGARYWWQLGGLQAASKKEHGSGRPLPGVLFGSRDMELGRVLGIVFKDLVFAECQGMLGSTEGL